MNKKQPTTNDPIASDERILKEFNEKFYSIPDKTCLWHRNQDLREFIVSALLSARAEERKRIQKNIGMLRQWLNEKDKELLVTNEMIEMWLFQTETK